MLSLQHVDWVCCGTLGKRRSYTSHASPGHFAINKERVRLVYLGTVFSRCITDIVRLCGRQKRPR